MSDDTKESKASQAKAAKEEAKSHAISYLGRQVRPIRLDLVVHNLVIVELKAVNQLHDIHTSQMLTYLKLTRLPVGIVLNFNVRHMRDGIRRYIRPQRR